MRTYYELKSTSTNTVGGEGETTTKYMFANLALTICYNPPPPKKKVKNKGASLLYISVGL